MARLPFLQVDAFAAKLFSGNPAAVVFLPRARPKAWLQAVAREMNLSETAFLLPRGRDWSLRWFTPAVEVDLCGHGTLAAAHSLWETRRLAPERTARFHTRSGLLTAERRGAWIGLDFPAARKRWDGGPADLMKALGTRASFVARYGENYLVEVASEARLRGLRPEMALLAKVDCGGVIVTARSRSRGFDFVSRYFAPRHGIAEDPVTGSAHCALGPY
jgi:PhzF family phenazine biosynthesis protein